MYECNDNETMEASLGALVGIIMILYLKGIWMYLNDQTRRRYELMAGSKWIYLSSCVALYSHATELACVSEYLYLVWILWFSYVGTSSMYHVLGHRISTWESIIDVATSWSSYIWNLSYVSLCESKLIGNITRSWYLSMMWISYIQSGHKLLRLVTLSITWVTRPGVSWDLYRRLTTLALRTEHGWTMWNPKKI